MSSQPFDYAALRCIPASACLSLPALARTLPAWVAILAVVLGSAACSAPSPPPQSELRSLRHDIINRTVNQAAHEVSWYEFSIPAGVNEAKISGTFRVFGGGEDILVVVTDEAGLTDFNNGMPYRAQYDSGQVSTATLNFTLSAGKYYLVISNRHTFVDAKTIQANIYAEY